MAVYIARVSEATTAYLHILAMQEEIFLIFAGFMLPSGAARLILSGFHWKHLSLFLNMSEYYYVAGLADMATLVRTIGKILSCITVSADQKAATVHFISSLSFVQMSLNAAHFLCVLKYILSSHKECDSFMRNRPRLHGWMQIDLAIFCLCRVQWNRCEYLQCLRERIQFTSDCLCPLLHA